MRLLKVKHTAYISNSLKHKQGEKIRVLMPMCRSNHWVTVVLDLENQAVTGIRYYDSLTVPSESCHQMAKTLVECISLLLNCEEELQLPVRANLVVQPIGSNKCGWYTLAFIENEVREFLGEGPAGCHVALTVASYKPRLISFTKALAAEA